MNDFSSTNRSQRFLRILRVFRVLCLAFLALSILIALAFCFVFSKDGRPGGGGDFNIRYSEVRCLFDGMDPFKVYTGEIASDKYGPYNKWTREKPFLPVNGYVPWEYTYMMPFAALPKIPASVLWICLNAAALVFLLKRGKYLASCHANSVLKKEFLSSCILVLSAPIACLFNWGNFGLLFAVVILWMADALNRKQDILAGILWALLMAKPQIGLLLAIPIALRFRWKTALTAVVVSVAASIPPAMLCHSNPVQMTVDILTCSQRGQFCMDLLPASWASVFASGTPQHLFMLGGALLCLACCLLLRRSSDWSLLLLPPVFVSTVWTYGWPHDHCIYALPVFVIGVVACEERNRTTRNWLLVAMALCGASILLVNSIAEPTIVSLARRALAATLPTEFRGHSLAPYIAKQPKGVVYSVFAIAKVLAFGAVCCYLSRKPTIRISSATD